MRMIHGYRVSQIVATLAQLQIADALTDDAKTVEQLAHATDIDRDGLERLLRAAVTIGVLDDSARGRFALTALGALLRSEATGSLRERRDRHRRPRARARSRAASTPTATISLLGALLHQRVA
jgi:hypothetical protein